MSAVWFALRSLVRQPARSLLGILGVAAVGALLFDMLLLSDGLVVSMRDLLERTGFDVRVTRTGDVPARGQRLTGAAELVAAIDALPAVRSALAIRFADAEVVRNDEGRSVAFQAVEGGPSLPWTVLRGQDVSGPLDVVINATLAGEMALKPGDSLTLRASCESGSEALPPVTFRIAGVAEFPFEAIDEHTVAGRMTTLERACGGNGGNEADMILVMSNGDADAAAQAISAAQPGVRAVTNEEMVGRFQQTGFTYFQQISAVLTLVTSSFAVLLITVLLTVSVNQRIGEIAALRALGFSRRRVVSDVFCEAALLVGAGGLLSVPLGLVLARGLDGILKGMPGLPAELHFFVFEPDALLIHGGLLAATTVVAAAWPMVLVARLPIAATLRAEVAS